MDTLRNFSTNDKVIRLDSSRVNVDRYAFGPIYAESADGFTDIPLGSRINHFISKDGKRKITYYFESVHNKWRIYTQELTDDYVPISIAPSFNRQQAWRNSRSPIVSRSQWMRIRGS